MIDAVLVLNAGSSSVKFCVYTLGDERLALFHRGQVERINTAPHFLARDASGVIADEQWTLSSGTGAHQQALDRLGAWLTDRLNDIRLLAVGHRVVHGGVDLREPVLVDDTTLETLETLIPLAPLHQPHNIAAIKAVSEVHPELPQIACFDTAFHRGHPNVADRFALPSDLYESGVRRFGFHGLSYEYIAWSLKKRAPHLADGRVVVAHLGNGASMCALRDGRSMDSTLGFTALDGLPMGTRCGSLDPGVVIHLLRSGMSLEELEDLLYTRSGLLGLSGLSNDMRRLEQSDSPRAVAAIDYFVYRIVRELGGLAAVLGGLDAIVFTAGIGANSPGIREAVCRGSAWLGIQLDDQANAVGEGCVSVSDTTPSVWVLQTDEERMIAMHTLALVGRSQTSA